VSKVWCRASERHLAVANIRNRIRTLCHVCGSALTEIVHNLWARCRHVQQLDEAPDPVNLELNSLGERGKMSVGFQAMHVAALEL